jgi:hypothetical protein
LRGHTSVPESGWALQAAPPPAECQKTLTCDSGGSVDLFRRQHGAQCGGRNCAARGADEGGAPPTPKNAKADMPGQLRFARRRIC